MGIYYPHYLPQRCGNVTVSFKGKGKSVILVTHISLDPRNSNTQLLLLRSGLAKGQAKGPEVWHFKAIWDAC